MSSSDLLAAARGDIPADLVLRNGRVVNVFTGEIEQAEIAIHGDRIAGVGSGYKGKQFADLHGSYVAPVRPPLPAVKQTDWPRNEIDYFILSRLEREGLAPSPEADSATLIRRGNGGNFTCVSGANNSRMLSPVDVTPMFSNASRYRARLTGAARRSWSAG